MQSTINAVILLAFIINFVMLLNYHKVYIIVLHNALHLNTDKLYSSTCLTKVLNANAISQLHTMHYNLNLQEVANQLATKFLVNTHMFS